MDINKEKEIAELNKAYESESHKLGAQIQKKIELSAANAIADFDQYFRSKEFKVTPGQRSITAEYNGLVIKLSHEDTETAFIGSYLPFELTIRRPANSKGTQAYAINLVSTKSATRPPYGSDEAEQLRQKINLVTERLDNFNNEKWVLLVTKNHTQFNSLKDILVNLFETTP